LQLYLNISYLGDNTSATYYKMAMKNTEKAHNASMLKNFQLMLAFAPISLIFVHSIRSLWTNYASVIENVLQLTPFA